MICKFCNAEVDDTHKFCPHCGKDLNEELPEQELEVPVKKKRWPIVAAIAGAVVALAALAVVLLTAMGIDILPRGNDILKKDNYTVSDEKAAQKADVVVATIGDKKLTNSQLVLYYRSQLISFVNYYGSYLGQLGMDISKPLNEQMCVFEGYEEQTWQQYLLEISIQTWERYQTMGMLAEEAGFTLSEEAEAELEAIPKTLEEQAAASEYENAEAMIADIIGPGCGVEEFVALERLALFTSEFYNSEVERLMPDQEEIDAYFTENAASFEQNGITKESGLYASVRHILIAPEGGTTDETTQKVTYSEDEWAAALAKAESVLETWKNGEATEESFGELAKTETADEASIPDGGLYTDIYKGSGMVEEFEAWAIDPARVTGDTGIVKTVFGYHIMYFVEGELNWLRAGRTQLLSDRTTAMIDEATAKWPMKVTYSKIAIPEMNMQ